MLAARTCLALAAALLLAAPVSAQQRPPRRNPASCPMGCWQGTVTKGTASRTLVGEMALLQEDPGNGFFAIHLSAPANVVLQFLRSGGGRAGQGSYALPDACPDNDRGPAAGAFVAEYQPFFNALKQGAFSRGGTLVIESSTAARVSGHFALTLCFLDGPAGTAEGWFDARNPAAGM